MQKSILIILLLNLTLAGGALAAAAANPPVATAVVSLWPDGPAESQGLHEAEQVKDYGSPDHPNRSVRNITEPDLEFFRALHSDGCGVIILPGGGYYAESIDLEGRDIARWFNSIGVDAFVLKYRLPNTDTHRFGPEVPLQDAQRALRLVRFHAAEWGVQTNRIGVLGFSAGGHLASTLATHFDAGNTGASDPLERVSCHPDFLMLGYPVISMKAGLTHAGSRNELLGKDPSPELVERLSSELHVTASTPPMFIFCATDDNGVKVDNSLDFYNAARAAGVSAELHIFEKGGHGFGMKPNNCAGASWPPLCESWLRKRGLLDATTAAAPK